MSCNRLECPVAAFLAVSFALAGSAVAEPPRLTKGIATDIWVEWHRIGEVLAQPRFHTPYPDWPDHVSDARLARLKAEGFDFVRMPIDPEPLLLLDPGEMRFRLISEIVARARQIHAAGLTVIVDLHTIPRDESGGTERIVENPATWDLYLELVGQVGAAIADLDPARTLFEPINEPVHDCDAVQGQGDPAWPSQLAELHRTARAAAPDLTLVLSGACWGGVEGLAGIDPASLADDNVIWSFHSYEPFIFTHQGAGWTVGPVAFLTEIPYPPSRVAESDVDRLADLAFARAEASALWFADGITREAIRAEIEGYRALPDDVSARDLSAALDWARTHGIPPERLILGEFGVIGGIAEEASVLPEDRLRFLADKRGAAEAAGVAWSVWSWVGSLGIAEGPDRAFLPGICDALALSGC